MRCNVEGVNPFSEFVRLCFFINSRAPFTVLLLVFYEFIVGCSSVTIQSDNPVLLVVVALGMAQLSAAARPHAPVRLIGIAEQKSKALQII